MQHELDNRDHLRSGARLLNWTWRFVLFGALLAAIALGGPVIRTIAVVATVLAIFADRDGFARHVVRLLSLVVAVALAPSLGLYVGAEIGPLFGLGPIFARIIGIVAVLTGVAILAGLIGKGLTRLIHRNPLFGCGDRVAGSLFGAGEGAVMVCVGIWLLAMFGGPIKAVAQQASESDFGQATNVFDRVGQLYDIIESDPAGRWLVSRNPLPELPGGRIVQQIADLSVNGQAMSKVLNDPRLQNLQALPAVKKHLDAIYDDPELRTALQNHDFIAIARSDQFKAMLNDEELLDAIGAHWDDFKQVVQKVDAQEARTLAQQAGSDDFQRRLAEANAKPGSAAMPHAGGVTIDRR